MVGKRTRTGPGCFLTAAFLTAVLLTAGPLLSSCQARDQSGALPPEGQENRSEGDRSEKSRPEEGSSEESRSEGGSSEKSRSGEGSSEGGSSEESRSEEGDSAERQFEGSRPEENQPGELRDGVYFGDGGIFTVQADEDLWEVSEVDGDRELRLRRNPSVWISFSPSEGISLETIKQFETDFAKSYAEAVREGYPDAKIVQIRHVNQQMAGLDLTMTDPTGRYSMYQLLYLATDGKESYLITSTLSEEEAEEFLPEVEAVIESFEFQDGA